MSENNFLKRGLPVGKSFVELPAGLGEGPASKKLRESMTSMNSSTSCKVLESSSISTTIQDQQTKPETRQIASAIPIPRIVSTDDIRFHHRAASPTITGPRTTASINVATKTSAPQYYLMSLIQSKAPQVSTVSSLSIEKYFLKYDQANYDSYTSDAIAAIRQQDISALRSIRESGRTLQATNRFGESLLHMACRRGFTSVVRYLLTVGGLSPNVRDDMGRTPAHDACWTCEPNEELLEILIEQCPELLIMKDRRGSTPFEYIRGDHSVAWMKFLSQKKHLIQMETVISRMKSIQPLKKDSSDCRRKSI